MTGKKFVFVLSHAVESPAEVIVMMKTATNMKAFDEEIELDFFLMGEGVQLAKKGIADTITMELEGQKVIVGEMLKTLTDDFNVKLFVCHAFMPLYGMTKDDLIESAELKSSSYLGELMLDGRVPFQVSV